MKILSLSEIRVSEDIPQGWYTNTRNRHFRIWWRATNRAMLHGCVTLVRRPRYPGRGWFSKDVGRACQKQPGVLARVHMHLRRGVCTCNGTRQSMSAVPSSWQDARRNMPNDLFPPSPIPPAPSRSSAPFCRISLCLSLPPSLSSLSSFHPLYLLSLSRSSAVPLSFESWLTRPRDCLPLAYRLMQLYVLRQFAPICVASSLSLSLSLSLHRACLFSASYSPLAPLPSLLPLLARFSGTRVRNGRVRIRGISRRCFFERISRTMGTCFGKVVRVLENDEGAVKKRRRVIWWSLSWKMLIERL